MHTNKLRISVIKFEGTKHTNTRECTKIFGARIYFYPIFCVGMKNLEFFPLCKYNFLNRKTENPSMFFQCLLSTFLLNLLFFIH